MKISKIILAVTILLVFIVQLSSAQSRKTLPIDTNTVNVNEIPDENVLRSSGLKEDEIIQILEFKKRKLSEGNNPTMSNTKQTPVDLETKSILRSKTDSIQVVNAINAKPKSKNEIFGQDLFINNNFEKYNLSSSIKAQDNYILGIGDELSISVYGYSYFNDVFKVNENGKINIDKIGPVHVQGLTFAATKNLIRSKLRQYFDLNNNKVDITLSFSRVISVNFVGEVNNPGTYKIPANTTLFNSLISVGGPNDLGSLRNIVVKRAGKVVYKLDVYEFLYNPGKIKEFYLENNDFVFFESIKKVVEIRGEIKKPYKYELKDNENIIKLIEFAGGLTSNAYRFNIQIDRNTDVERKIINVNLDSLIKNKRDFELFDGDKIVLRSIISTSVNYVDIEGAVKMPGRFELQEKITVYDLINKAEGLTDDAFKNRAYVIRLQDDLQRKFIPVNIDAVLKDSNSAENIPLVKGDIVRVVSKAEFNDNFNVTVYGNVRNPNSFQYYSGMTLHDVLFLSGGFGLGADVYRVEISRISNFTDSLFSNDPTRVIIDKFNVSRNLSTTDPNLNYPLLPYDNIFVRTIPNFNLQQNIRIVGEVKYPGEYTLINKNEKISDVIKRAGGITKYSFPKGATLYRPELDGGFIVLKLEKALKKYDSKFNYTLRAGDVLEIPKVIDFVGIRGTSIENIDLVDGTQINAPYHQGRRAKFYVNEYGNGFGKKSWRKKTYVVDSNKKINKTKNFYVFKIYPKVDKGSIIHVVRKPDKVKEKKDEEIDYNKLLDSTLVRLTSLATFFFILRQLN